MYSGSIVISTSISKRMTLSPHLSTQHLLTNNRDVRTMIRGLSAGVEQNVLRNVIATSKTVVEVETSSGKIEDNIVSKGGLGSLGLRKGIRR